jgi:nicotinamide-nucleotide amidase
VYGFDDETLASSIHALLQRDARTIATAESCTGGSIAAELTSVSGSSKSFVGGVVAYDNSVKRELLGVREETLNAFGAVSEETAREMARGVRTRLHADIGLSITGIAGPTGATPDKPVGLVWVGLAHASGESTMRLNLSGNRSEIQRRATVAALGSTWRFVQSNVS